MKKILIIAAAVFLCAGVLPVFAQQADDAENGLTYVNVTVFKVFDHKDAYIVVYGKQSNKTATVVIPKSWSVKQPRKLEFRKMVAPMNQPIMTVFFRGGTFERVFLTMPQDRRNNVWGAAPYADVAGELDKESLKIEFD